MRCWYWLGITVRHLTFLLCVLYHLRIYSRGGKKALGKSSKYATRTTCLTDDKALRLFSVSHKSNVNSANKWSVGMRTRDRSERINRRRNEILTGRTLCMPAGPKKYSLPYATIAVCHIPSNWRPTSKSRGLMCEKTTSFIFEKYYFLTGWRSHGLAVILQKLNLMRCNSIASLWHSTWQHVLCRDNFMWLVIHAVQSFTGDSHLWQCIC